MGRWLSQDPIGFAAGDANLYRYVGNGATNATDPSGLFEGAHFSSRDFRAYQEWRDNARSGNNQQGGLHIPPLI